MKRILIVLTVIHFSLFVSPVSAQNCGIENTAFKSGERLIYDLAALR